MRFSTVSISYRADSVCALPNHMIEKVGHFRANALGKGQSHKVIFAITLWT